MAVEYIKSVAALYQMGPLDTVHLNERSEILRVPGGWIFKEWFPPEEGTDQSVFVPFDNEYMMREAQKPNSRSK